MSDTREIITDTSKKLNSSGFVKIWRVNKTTGESELVVSKKNMILYQGSDLMAQALAGVKYAKIAFMYMGYKTTADIEGFTPPTIDRQYSNKFSDYNNVDGLEDLGYLRLPIAYTPSYLATTNYQSNTVIFTSIVSNNSSAYSGAEFLDSSSETPSYLFEVALVAALNPSSSVNDIIFSRADFEPIVYDSNYNLTLTWGVQFLS